MGLGHYVLNGGFRRARLDIVLLLFAIVTAL